MAALIWHFPDDEGVGSRYAIAPNHVIGRGKDCHVHIDRVSLSRRHARLRLDINGWMVEDLGSTNGTRINDVPVGGPTTLRHADFLRVGDVILRFDDEPEQVPSDREGGGGGGQPSAVAFVTEEDDN